jgi:uncharacterized protein (DUF2235 family)
MKRLILCCDGTWNSADQERNGRPCPTNVLKLATRIANRDAAGVTQVIFYEQGVGTGNALDRLTGGAFGQGLENNILSAYRFLLANYEAGDEVFLFGFSRGAYTARSLAGMVRKCGILDRKSVGNYLEAIALYRRRDDGGAEAPAALDFRKRFSITRDLPIPIKLVGVWDTVGSLGIPLRGVRNLTQARHQFHDVQLSRVVEHAYHALAIDERRGPFAPTLWYKQKDTEQTVEQVWFAGAHSDVGGGYAEAGLSDIALEWMIAKASGAGLAFDQEAMEARSLQPDPAAVPHRSRRGLYLLTPGVERQIGLRPVDPTKPQGPKEPDPTQSVHESVLRRWAASDWRPSSLVRYFDGPGRGHLEIA